MRTCCLPDSWTRALNAFYLIVKDRRHQVIVIARTCLNELPQPHVLYLHSPANAVLAPHVPVFGPWMLLFFPFAVGRSNRQPFHQVYVLEVLLRPDRPLLPWVNGAHSFCST